MTASKELTWGVINCALDVFFFAFGSSDRRCLIFHEYIYFVYAVVHNQRHMAVAMVGGYNKCG